MIVRRWLPALCCASLLSGCASLGAPPSCRIVAKPIVRKQPVAWHLFDVTVLSQIEQGLNPARVARKGLGIPQPAHNLVNGEVSEGSFFADRPIESLDADAIRRGPTRPDQHATPPFVITRLKQEGKTPGFFVRDASGGRFLFKLDLAGYPELVTGAEVVASKLLHALGYYVPSYEIVTVEPKDLALSADLAAAAQADLQRLLAGHAREGRVRVSASRFLDGEILGPFRFQRHRDCAELRALKLAYAWINNTDAKDHNTLLAWSGNAATGFLIDFGSSLGADASHGPKRPCQGWLNDVDLKELMLETLTLGLRDNGCDPQERPFSAAVGLFSPRFDPIRWKPYAPNLAFEEITQADARWMAKRIAAFSREQLVAAVDAGRYHDPEDSARIVEVLEARRQAIRDAYLNPEVTP
jgi:hypothetical protein